MRNCTTHRSFSKFIVLSFVLLAMFAIAISVGLTYGGGVAFAAEADVDNGSEQFEDIKSTVVSIVNSYVVPALCIVVSVVMLVLGVISGIQIAKASSEEEKTKAKKKLWGIGAGLVVSIASIWLVPLLISFLVSIFGGSTIL